MDEAKQDAGRETVDGEQRKRRHAALEIRSEEDLRAREYFPDSDPDHLYESSRAWPVLTGCLIILFTSRSGSTYLSEEIENRYAVGNIRESFNLPNLQRRRRNSNLGTPAATLRRAIRQCRENGWFAAKAGRPGLVVAERCGFFDEYLDRTNFILLLRRDLVAQAVSMHRAKTTSRYHYRQTEMKPATDDDYSYNGIARGIEIISNGVDRLVAYAHESARPLRTVAYEEFADGDFRAIEAICDEFGLPRRTTPPRRLRQIEKIGDEINAEWCARFREQMDDRMRGLLERQLERLRSLKRAQE